MRIAIPVFAIMLSLAVFRYGGEETLVNSSPLARVMVDGREAKLNTDVAVPRRFLDVVADGFVDDQYVAELPTAKGVVALTLEFPWVVRINRMLLVGWGGGGKNTLEITAFRDSAQVWNDSAVDWSVNSGKPPIVTLAEIDPANRIQFVFRGEDRVAVNSIQCFVRVPRWKAWCWFLGFQVIVPWVVGGVWALALFGWGRLLCGTARDENNDLARTLLVGLTAMTFLSALWLSLSQTFLQGWMAIFPAAAIIGPAIPMLFRRPSPRHRRLLIVLAAVGLLLLSLVAVESTIVANRRVKPMDHLFGLMTAKHLLADRAVPDEMMLRPWLVPALSLPMETLGGRFSYWIYLGQMAWINVIGLAMIASVAQRWKMSRVFTAAMIGLSPLTTAFHFPGQRVLVAGLCLLAIDEWTSRKRANWSWWGGWAAAAAVLAHPGALFILPPAALYFLFRRPRRTAVLGLLSVGIAVGIYLLWTQYAYSLRPEVRNNLANYPFMRALDDRPTGDNLREIVAGLSAEQWRDLALNRVKQIRHYIWADNPWQNALFERTRAVSLTSTLGVVLTLCALVHLIRFENRGVIWIGVVGPLALFHLHIGQSFPQFHILPTPFFALALIGLAAMPRFGKWATTLVVAEALLHLLFAPALVLTGLAGEFELPGWFAGDSASKFLCVIPVVPWIVLASAALRCERGFDD